MIWKLKPIPWATALLPRDRETTSGRQNLYHNLFVIWRGRSLVSFIVLSIHYLVLYTMDAVLTGPAEGIPGVAQTPEEYLSWLDDLVGEMKQIGYMPKLRWLTARKA